MCTATTTTSIFLNVCRATPSAVALTVIHKGDDDGGDTGKKTIVTNADVLAAMNQGRIELRGVHLQVLSATTTSDSNSNNKSTRSKLYLCELLALSIPTATLLGAIVGYLMSNERGYEAVFPSESTVGIAWKVTVWGTLLSIVLNEQLHFWTNYLAPSLSTVGVELRLEGTRRQTTTDATHTPIINTTHTHDMDVDDSHCTAQHTHQNDAVTAPLSTTEFDAPASPTAVAASDDIHTAHDNPPSFPPAVSPAKAAHYTDNNNIVPFRFVRATKGDLSAARKRYDETLTWRAEMDMDTILHTCHPKLALIKQHYPHYFHLRGIHGEPVYYECPPRINLVELKRAGVQLNDLLRHYAICCEYMWTYIETSDDGRSIYILDLEGMGIRDFAGEVLEFVKRASAFTAAHYPERSGTIFVLNVPSWFSIVWNTIKPMVDEVTRTKIKILRAGNDAAITRALTEKIDLHNIPPEYGGTSVGLGESSEEIGFMNHFQNLNERPSTLNLPTDETGSG